MLARFRAPFAVGALATVVAVLLLLAQSAAAREIPLRKARVVAYEKLLAYASTFTYVTDYELTRCSRATAGRVLCEFRIARFTGETCTGTLVVTSTRTGPSARFRNRCSFSSGSPPPPSPSPPPSPGPAPPPPTPGGAYTDLGDIHSVDTLSSDGSTIVLEDGSIWTVAASYRDEVVADWEADDDIDVEAGPGSSYSLTDDDADETIVATFDGFQP